MQTNVSICIPTFSFADMYNNRTEVYVPGMKFQVLYLLHGGSGDDSDFIHFSNIVRYADENKVAVVMPCDYNACYTDAPDGPKYYSYLVEELPRVCASMFPISDKREDTFIGGLSMGSSIWKHRLSSCLLILWEINCRIRNISKGQLMMYLPLPERMHNAGKISPNYFSV